MDNKEKIELLMKKTNVSYEDAKRVLEECNWDVLDAVVKLEREGKVENNEVTTIIEVKEEKQKEEKFGGVGELVGRMFKFLGKFIKKGNENYFEIRKNNEKPIRISLTISILLLVFLSVPTVVLLIVGLFCGYKYSLAGKKVNYDGVNTVFEEVSKSADSVKKDFKAGYES
ncbi:DUF4342 domain-containing protein [uncultured Clostridium sp.]|uniref:DUF4342 domain-containing protein n=1 Tax=uncultured Clostridium sp. TaxID=59620 RepID=UPI00261D4294|nr:DUF4342 domain-containing protein [uncultured Clostridium sp.]